MVMEVLDEHEQGELVLAWLRQNGIAIVGGIGLGLAGIFGWQWWQHQSAQHSATAASQHAALLEAATAGNRDLTVGLAGTLAKEFGDTPYVVLANLRLAEVQFMHGDVEPALATLQSIAGTAKDASLNDLVALRIARLQIAIDKPAEALTTLQPLGEDSFTANAAELRGDAQLALGKPDQARAAYTQALTAMDAASPARRLLEMKLTDIGGQGGNSVDAPLATPET